MRIGPFKIKLKPLIVYPPLFIAPYMVYSYHQYRTVNLEFKKREDDIVLQTQLTVNQISEKQFPTVYYNPLEQFYISMDELEGQIKVFVFSDQTSFRRVHLQMEKVMKRFQIRYNNIVHQDQVEKTTPNTLTIGEKVENQIIVSYDNNIVYQNKLIDQTPVQVIERIIAKMIDKEFLSKIKF